MKPSLHVLGYCCGEVAAPRSHRASRFHRAAALKAVKAGARCTPSPVAAAGLVPHSRHVVDEHRPSPSREPGRPASRKGSSASASGLKKLLCSLSQSTKQRLGRFRCYSMEQLPAPGSNPPDGPGMKKSPSLQSLRLVSQNVPPREGTGKVPQEEGC